MYTDLHKHTHEHTHTQAHKKTTGTFELGLMRVNYVDKLCVCEVFSTVHWFMLTCD